LGQTCKVCGKEMRLLDEEQQKWYCYKDDVVYFGKESRWNGLPAKPLKIEIPPLKRPISDASDFLNDAQTVLDEIVKKLGYSSMNEMFNDKSRWKPVDDVEKWKEELRKKFVIPPGYEQSEEHRRFSSVLPQWSGSGSSNKDVSNPDTPVDRRSGGPSDAGKCCAKCGVSLPPDSAFCNKCGSKQ